MRRELAELLAGEINDPAGAAEQLDLALLADPENLALRKKMEGYRRLAQAREKAFGADGIEWLRQNHTRLEEFGSQLAVRLGERLLGCACLPPDQEESENADEREDKQDAATPGKEKLPRMLVLLSDIKGNDTDIESEIGARERIIAETLERYGLPKKHIFEHWSGLWGRSFDGKYALFRDLAPL